MWQESISTIFLLLKYIVTAILVKTFITTLIRYYKWCTHPIWNRSKTNIGGPEKSPFSSSFFLGRFLTLTREPFPEPQLRWLNEASQSKYSSNHVHYCILNGKHTVLTRDATLSNEILVTKPREFPRAQQPFLVNMLHKGLLTLELNDDWARHKRIIQPCFQLSLLKENLGCIVPGVVQNLMECWRIAGSNAEIDITVHMSHLTLDIIGLAAFGHDFKAMNSICNWSHQVKSTNEAGRENATGVANRKESRTDEKTTVTSTIDPVSDTFMSSVALMLRNILRSVIFTTLGLSFLDTTSNRGNAAMSKAVDKIIDNARTRSTSSSFSSAGLSQGEKLNTEKKEKIGSKSLLETLLMAIDSESNKRKRLNQEELRSEIKTFLLAGHETTAKWCTWCCFVLCQYPSIQQKVYEDIVKHHKPSSDKHTDTISLESIEKMTYLNAFLQEVLRFYPPVGLILKDCTRDYKYKDITIPAKTRVGIYIALLHRHPDYWTTHDPEEFHPERWLGTEYPATTTKAFIPFSAGTRNCIGYSFATLEAKLIMAHLIRSFQFYRSPSQENVKTTVKLGLTNSPNPDVLLCVRPRT